MPSMTLRLTFTLEQDKNIRACILGHHRPVYLFSFYFGQ
jgi:hypothetical protein